MTGLTSKDREALAYIYELNEFKAFKKWCQVKREKAAEQIIGIDMSQPGSKERIAMLQGQAYALEFILKEWQNLYKKSVDNAKKER